MPDSEDKLPNPLADTLPPKSRSGEFPAAPPTLPRALLASACATLVDAEVRLYELTLHQHGISYANERLERTLKTLRHAADEANRLAMGLGARGD